ncbi:unnamed protein product, partial [Symbiodinium necroappetens]
DDADYQWHSASRRQERGGGYRTPPGQHRTGLQRWHYDDFDRARHSSDRLWADMEDEHDDAWHRAEADIQGYRAQRYADGPRGSQAPHRPRGAAWVNARPAGAAFPPIPPPHEVLEAYRSLGYALPSRRRPPLPHSRYLHRVFLLRLCGFRWHGFAQLWQPATGSASASLDSSFQLVGASQQSAATEIVDLTGHRLKLSPHGDLPTVADLARPRSMQAAQIPAAKTACAAAPVEGPSLPAMPLPMLLPPRPLRVKVNSTRQSAMLRHQACGTAWCQLLHKLHSASKLWVALQPCKDSTEHMLAVLINFRPSTLERYLRAATLFLSFMQSSALDLHAVSLAGLLDFLAAARASSTQDREIHQMSANSSIKALRWLAKHSQWCSLDSALHRPVISAYAARGTAKDRREALPVPWCLVAAWEMRVCGSATPVTTTLALGAALLCIHASIRFGDVQHIDFSSLSLSRAALHGICFATKTTSTGQPFAVSVAGLTGRSAQSCWTLHWLAALHSQAQAFGCPDTFDFLWPNAAPELSALPELAPASYCSAMLTMRWAATLPWLPPGQGLLPAEAKQLTLHSLKSTCLAAAAQLRIDKEARLLQGHHRDSAALYSRNDTFASIDVQAKLCTAMAEGWRPERSMSRGGQAPVPEPPFALPPGPVLQSLSAADLLAGAWSYFTTRHEQLQAAEAALAQQAQPEVLSTQLEESQPSPPPQPTPIDVEAEMVEEAALARQASDSSAQSSVSSLDSEGDQAPLELRMPGSACKYARNGPWGRWHAVRSDAMSTQPRTACGIALGIAGQYSELGTFAPPGRDRVTGLAIIRNSNALQELLSSFQVPDSLCAALAEKGLTSVPDFAYAFSKASELDCFCSEDYAQLWQDLQVDDPAHSPAMARLRRAHVRAQAVSLAEDATPQPSIARPPAQPQINSWAEHAPPRLDASVIAQLTKDFKANCPGEFLDSDAMPSVRLLSIVHKWFAPQGTITWVPWQLRLSHKQYQEIIESKSSKMLRTEAQFLSTALFDETPEMPVEHLRLSPAWLSRIQTVFRNAIALCKGAHLARLKALDKKVLDAATQSPSDPSLDGWTLDDALHELTMVRADVANLLQLRAKPPPPPTRPPRKDPKGTGKGKTDGKTGKGNATPTLKRKTPGDSTAKEIKAGDLVSQHGDRTFCIRWNKGTCRNAQCKYLHACALKLPNGEPCGRSHPACKHKSPPEPASS